MAAPCVPNEFFAFGPSQSFVAYITGIYKTSSNFSSEITNRVAVDNVKAINFVAFPSSTTDPKSTTGEEKTLALDRLEVWVKNQDKKSERVEVVCNSKGEFWIRVSYDGTTIIFDQGLTIETRQWLKNLNLHGAYPTCVALGTNDSYIIVYEDTHVVGDLKGCYDGLDKRLSQVLATSTTLFYVALNPYSVDEFYCQSSDGSCTFNFADARDFKALESLIFEGPLRVIVDSETLRQSSDVVPVLETAAGGKESGGFAKKVMEKALADMTEKSFEGDPTDLLGSL